MWRLHFRLVRAEPSGFPGILFLHHVSVYDGPGTGGATFFSWIKNLYKRPFTHLGYTKVEDDSPFFIEHFHVTSRA
jgi:hypothetical protein